MQRREFLRAGLMSAALAASPSSAKKERVPKRAAPQNGSVELANEQIAWTLEWREGKLLSKRCVNKLSGSQITLIAEEEFSLTFSSAQHRIEIPWWKFVYGPDAHAVAPEDEQGFRLGYALTGFSDRDWGTCENLLLRGLRGAPKSRAGTRYDGYGWFRSELELPSGALGKEIHFVLGGHDFLDWQEYWIYINGAEIAHRTSAGRWRSPGHFTFSPSDTAYGWLRFGGNEKNILAVRTRGFDKHFGGYSDDVIRHYVFEPVLADQFVAVGQPYARATDWMVTAVAQSASSHAAFSMASASLGLRATAHYELDGATRRKWLEVENSSDKEMLLLDAEIDNYSAGVKVSEGGQGEPVFIGEEAFAALEHPSGLNQGDGEKVRLLHFPGKRLAPGAAWRSQTSLLSVSKKGAALESFVDYVQERSPRKKKLTSIYTPFGINNQWGGCPTLDDREALRILDRLGDWQTRGVKFDYFTLDWGWVDQSSDMTRFATQCFPNGEKKIVERVHELGMRFGLWYSVAHGGKSIGENPAVAPSFILRPGDPDPPQPSTASYRNGYLADGGVPEQLCVASEPYFRMLREAVLYQMRENGLKLFKLDMGNYHCNSTHHQHLPGKYSTEAMYDRLLNIARAAHAADPDVFVVWYWGLRSPFFALNGDVIFETRLFMEGSGTSWFPTLYYRDSVTLNLDQSTRFANTIPPINKDSLGIWISDIRWGNFMGSERWREGLVMDLGRGNLLFPQIWSNILELDDHDAAFLASMMTFAKEHESLLLTRRKHIGDPWKNEVYGYAYGAGDRGLVFLNNVHFTSREAQLRLGPEMGLDAPAGTPVEITTRFPDEQRLVCEDGSPFRVGDTVALGVRPFEVLLLKLAPAGTAAANMPQRKTYSRELAELGAVLRLVPQSFPDSLSIRFADAARFEKLGHKPQASAFQTSLPAFDDDNSILAIAVRLLKDGGEWHYAPTVVEIVQVVARIGDQKVPMIPVPDARQYGNTQSGGASWVVYKLRLSRKWIGAKLSFAVHAYLPPGVEAKVDAWVVKQWWTESPGPRGDGYYADEPS